MAMGRQPARERHQRIKIRHERRFAEGSGQALSGMESGPDRRDPVTIRHRRQADGDARLLDRFADRRQASGAVLRRARDHAGKAAILWIDPAAREDQGTAGKRHRLGAFHHQQFRWAITAFAKDDHRCGGNGLGHGATLGPRGGQRYG